MQLCRSRFPTVLHCYIFWLIFLLTWNQFRRHSEMVSQSCMNSPFFFWPKNEFLRLFETVSQSCMNHTFPFWPEMIWKQPAKASARWMSLCQIVHYVSIVHTFKSIWCSVRAQLFVSCCVEVSVSLKRIEAVRWNICAWLTVFVSDCHEDCL